MLGKERTEPRVEPCVDSLIGLPGLPGHKLVHSQCDCGLFTGSLGWTISGTGPCGHSPCWP